ncbi:hypothetical protein EDD22DRAFT_849706 [Suillus occidentalis]|nr:hypothetical protein EDD22DRAFT_849706 [Suillus occidentalis]
MIADWVSKGTVVDPNKIQAGLCLPRFITSYGIPFFIYPILNISTYSREEIPRNDVIKQTLSVNDIDSVVPAVITGRVLRATSAAKSTVDTIPATGACLAAFKAYVCVVLVHAVDVDPEQRGILNFCRRTSYEQRKEGNISFMLGNFGRLNLCTCIPATQNRLPPGFKRTTTERPLCTSFASLPELLDASILKNDLTCLSGSVVKVHLSGVVDTANTIGGSLLTA